VLSEVEVCGHCHTPLPSGWYGTKTTCVAMAGARYTGKSVYIGVLYKQLEIFAASRKTVAGFLDPTVQRLYRDDYEEVLYRSRNLMRPTAPIRENPTTAQPLVFTLGPVDGQRSAVVIRDVAGEELEKGDLDPALFGFFQRSDVVFFLFDPLQVNSVRRMLRGQIPDPGAGGGDPLAVLQNLILLLRRGGSRPISVPLAVVLSKFDALHELRAIQDDDLGRTMRQTGAAFLRDPGPAPAFESGDADLLDIEVRSLLARIGGGAVLNLVEGEFSRSRFFGVSALGHPAGDGIQSSLGIAPFRCLDPVKWAFEL
jgi:hypothetical protein